MPLMYPERLSGEMRPCPSATESVSSQLQFPSWPIADERLLRILSRVRERLQSLTTSASDATGSNDLEPHSRPVDNSPQRPEDRDGAQVTGSMVSIA